MRGQCNLIPLHYYDGLHRVHLSVHQFPSAQLSCGCLLHSPHTSTRRTTPCESTTDDDRSLFTGNIRNRVLFRLDYWDFYSVILINYRDWVGLRGRTRPNVDLFQRIRIIQRGINLITTLNRLVN